MSPAGIEGVDFLFDVSGKLLAVERNRDIDSFSAYMKWNSDIFRFFIITQL